MKKYLFLSIGFIVLYVVFTITLLFIDRQQVGPNAGIVGYASINAWFHNLTGVNMLLYDITDYGGIPPIIMGIGFGVLGLVEWIKRRSIRKVDNVLLILGAFYIVVFLVYILFEFMVINRRPILINGFHEASYPSSTTFLSITFMLSAIIPIKKYTKKKSLKNVLIAFVYAYMLFLVIGRLISGVHWLTDIIGSIIIGLGLVFLYNFFIKLIISKTNSY